MDDGEIDVQGIIPARAGSSITINLSVISNRDHPRACGEQVDAWNRRTGDEGSSPRVRGAGLCGGSRSTDSEIIPARAGSRGLSCHRRLGRWDHPRACGEQQITKRSYGTKNGSSPRVRGAVAGLLDARRKVRIIPARAGSSGLGRPEWLVNVDHPRACGEQSKNFRLSSGRTGSSPRVRGAGDAARGACVSAGIIPARAGSSPMRRGTRSTSTDHPRACGEQCPYLLCDCVGAGSSPRVRGAAVPAHLDRSGLRIIPARAGSR